jgi:amino acid transporter
MNPWTCALLIVAAGGIGGVINAFMTDNGFPLPRREAGIWCPGAIANVLIGAFAAFASWALYGSGASIDLAHETERAVLSLKFSALAGALVVGIGGARWLTGEVDKRLLKESVKVVAQKNVSSRECDEVVKAPARQVLKSLQEA